MPSTAGHAIYFTVAGSYDIASYRFLILSSITLQVNYTDRDRKSCLPKNIGMFA